MLAAEKGPIHFVMLTDLTGPAHAQVAPEGWAAEDYIKWLNKHGGINGHPVTIEVIDTKYQLPLIRTAYARNKDRKQMTMSFDAISGGIEAHERSVCNRQNSRVDVYRTWTGALSGLVGFCRDCHLTTTHCALMQIGLKQTGKKNVSHVWHYFWGIMLQDGHLRRPNGTVEKIGVDIVSIEYVPVLPTDTSDLLIRMRDKKPDFVFDTLMPDQCKVVLKDRFKLGIKIPQANFVYNSDLIKATVPLEAYVGYMGLQCAASWWEKDVPGVKLAYELYKHRGPIPNSTYVSTLGGIMAWVEAVKNALNKVGYEKLDGQAIYDGYMQIKNFTAMGLFKEISYYPDDLRGSKWLKICKFNNDGSISNVTDWMEAPHNLKLKAKEGK